jgi:hypothetical protein
MRLRQQPAPSDLTSTCWKSGAPTILRLPSRRSKYTDRVKRNALPAILFSIPTFFVAYVAGYLTGISRAPAVGNLVPSLLVLIGGLNIYLFGTSRENIALVGYSVFIFTLVLFFGFEVGVIDREIGRVARLVSLSDQEKLVRNYRENRELPPDPPAWILGGEAR